MLQIGMIVDGRYKILREIGRGGTSCVYLAENVRLHSFWAIKEVYRYSGTGEDVQANMLIAESNILTRLRHPGLPTIIDVINTPHSFLIVMEYVEGVSLDKVLAQRGVCSQSDVIKWGQQLCGVLDYLHTQKPAIIYRDMKPGNVMLKPDGNIVLIDFGMARQFNIHNSHDTTNLGTHGYAAPEQYNGSRQSDARTDIYSLGVTLYHLVTGHDPCVPPYGINSICSINAGLSRDLDFIIGKCTQLHPENRYQTARELYDALGNVGSGTVFGNNNGYETPKKSKKWMFGLLAIPAVLIIAIGAVLAGGSGSSAPSSYPDYSDSSFPTYNPSSSEDVTLSFEQDVYITEADQREYYKFTPEKTGYYDIYSDSDEENPVIWLTDSDDNLIKSDNTSGDYEDFFITCWLEKGETYYIETTLYDLDPDVPATGSYWIYIDYSE